MTLKLRLLRLLGWKFYRWNLTAHSWDGETPPIFGYYPNIFLEKNAKVKRIRLEHCHMPSEKMAEEVAKMVITEYTNPPNKSKEE